MSSFILSINETQHRVSADPEMPLLWVLRDLLHLTGTKFGCGIGACGACTVHEDGNPVRSCQTQISATAGKHYTTIEGLSPDGGHPCQKAWIEEDVAQCGYCQAGMIMEAAALLRTKASVTHNITDAEIDAALSDHVCRCGTYERVRRAVHTACKSASKGASREVSGT